ncbi:MAG: RHS repeat-associated core domain-containing protein, partial [Myxococcaceae bacterium]|nr:RHS repeat-associated core domain-containing protein [Myxococcaceae bacterium]
LLNRLETRTFSNHALPRTLPSIEAQSFTYDENGNLTHITETKLTETGTVQQTTLHTYDRLDRRESTILPSNKSLSFDYYPAGQRKHVTDPDGVSTVYTYDALNRLSTASIPEGTTSFTFWPDSLPKATVLPNGLTEKRCYDAASRLSTIVLVRGSAAEDCTPEATLLSRFSYEYDSNGNRPSQTETRTRLDTGELGTPEPTMYGYDALDRLTGVAYPDRRAVLYRLDAVGNRTGEREVPSSLLSSLGPEAFSSLSSNQLSRDTTAVFNRADWLLSLSDPLDTSHSRTLIYDANGNLSSLLSTGRTRALSWDVRNTLTAVSDNGQELGRYDYDANLQRTWRRTAQENVAYVLDDGFVLQEMDSARLTKRRYHYAQKPLAVSDTTGTSSTTRFLSNDALDSASDATSTTGTVMEARKYDAWGKHREETRPVAENFKLGYTGHQLDVETGLTYARVRYYDSELGRFISRDSYEGSLEDAPSLHRYRYVRANPLRYVDPTGHQDIPLPQPDYYIHLGFMQWMQALFGGQRTNPTPNGHMAWIPPTDGVGGVYGGAARAVTLRALPIESNPSGVSQMGMELGASFVPVLDPVARLVSGTTVTGQEASRVQALGELSLELLPEAVSLASELRVAKNGVGEVTTVRRGVQASERIVVEGTNGNGNSSQVMANSWEESLPRWEDFLPQARERVSASRAAFSGVDLQGNLNASKPSGIPTEADATKGLPDDALVCRGGTCTADRFAQGTGVTLDDARKLQGVSVNSVPGVSLEQVTVGIPNKQVGVTTVGEVRAAGGDVLPSPTRNNPAHCTLCGITPQKAEELFTPTVRNPNAR